jgi:chromate transporter
MHTGDAGEPPASAASPARIQPVSLREILSLFVRIGVTSFGGGLSAWMYREVVGRRRWLPEDSFLSGLTLSQMLPGTNVVNLSVYIGQKLRGSVGSIIAVGGLLLPPMAIIVVLAEVLRRYGDVAWVHDLLEGVAAGAVGMTLSMVLRAARNATAKSRLAPLAILAVFALVGVLRWPMIPVVLALGLISTLIARRQKSVAGGLDHG